MLQEEVKTAKTVLVAAMGLGAVCLLGGCATGQALLAQTGTAGLPEKVARKLYGHCPGCQAIQEERRDGNTPLAPRSPIYRREARDRGAYRYRQNPDGTWKVRTKKGNSYPAWVHPHSSGMNQELAMAQMQAVYSDPEPAADYYDFLRWTSQNKEGTTREVTAKTKTESGRRAEDAYAALGY